MDSRPASGVQAERCSSSARPVSGMFLFFPRISLGFSWDLLGSSRIFWDTLRFLLVGEGGLFPERLFSGIYANIIIWDRRSSSFDTVTALYHRSGRGLQRGAQALPVHVGTLPAT